MATYDVKYWQGEIQVSKKDLERFHEAGEKVVNNYLDLEQSAQINEGIGARKYNMFWANIGILKSALYGNPPKPLAKREFQDPDDEVGRVAASMMERLLSTGPNGSGSDMHSAFQQSVEDRLLPGLGQIWLRYDAKIIDNAVGEVQASEIQDENVCTDYVYWRDFFYSPSRNWAEVSWVAKRVWMTVEAMNKRFGDKAKDVKLVIPKDGKSYDAQTSQADSLKRGEIYEIWCKPTRKIHWVSPDCETFLDEQDDQLYIPGFYPCPRPLVANITTTRFIGRADYTMVQDQYTQLNDINIRLGYLIEACKAVGVYDRTADGVQKMLVDGVENQLIPVDSWAAFAEKGGIKGVIDWLPVDAIAGVIEKLRETRADIVQQIYELTGISDIMRGVTNARETFGAQKLKSQYSSSRLQLYQMQVAEFVSEALNIKAWIISKHFQPETIIKKSLVMYTPDNQYAQAAVQLIKDSWELMYRINISSTQMSIPDYNAEKQDRQEFITAMGQYLSQASEFIQMNPKGAPFLLKILQWGAASFAGADQVETLFDNYIRTLEQQLQQPPQPNPEAQKIQAEMADRDKQRQFEQNKAQFDAGEKKSLAQFDAQTKTQLADIDGKVTSQLAEINNASKERIAAENNRTQLQIAEGKQADMFVEQARGLDDKQRELDAQQGESDLRARADEMRVQHILDSAMLEVKRLADEHGIKVKDSIMKAQNDAAKKDNQEGKQQSATDIKAMQKMHTDLMGVVGEMVKSMKGKKSVSITLPDGGEAKAEVTPHKE